MKKAPLPGGSKHARAKQKFSAPAGKVRWPVVKKYLRGGDFYMRLLKAVRDQRGFTLIELLVVITIIAVLSAMLVPRLLGYTDKARASRAMADLAAMKNVVEIYCADEGEGRYPGSSNDAGAQGTIANVLQDKGINWTGNNNGIKDPWGTSYRYVAVPDDNGTDNRKFVFQSAGPDKDFETPDDNIWCSSDSATVHNGGDPEVSAENANTDYSSIDPSN
jgi:general secretion pathway protein G